MRGADGESRRSPLRRAVDGYLDHLAIERGLAPNTLSSYRRDLVRYLDFSSERGIREVGDVQPGHIFQFSAWLREGDADHVPLAASSAARTVVALRGFHRFALREGLAEGDPAVAIKPPAPPRRLPKALSTNVTSP